jgi:hypothetical protein
MPIPVLSLDGFESDPEKKILRPHFRVGCRIYPHANNPVFPGRSTREIVINWDPVETEGTITSFAWSKRMGDVAGNWSMNLKLGREAALDPSAGEIMDGDWIEIEVMRNGVVFPLCRGVIDTVTEAGSSSGGARISNWSLVGRDHGALFEHPLAWNNIHIQSMAELWKGIGTEKIKGAPGGSPSELFKRLIDATFAQGTSLTQSSWTLPPALAAKVGGLGRFGGELKVNNSTPTRGIYMNEMQLWTKAGQNLHQTLSQWCNPLLNEYWYDAGSHVSGTDDQMQATIRERPFVNTTDGSGSPWFSVNETIIPAWIVEKDQLARSGRERFTIFQITADFNYGNTNEQAGVGAPLWSPEDVAQHGIRPWMETTKYINNSASVSGWVEEKDNWQRLAADWFGPNPYWLSGALDLSVMLPEVRVGERLRVQYGGAKDDLTSYVEGVDHSFEFGTGSRGPKSRSKILLSRGFRGTDEALLSMVQTVSGRFNAGKRIGDSPVVTVGGPTSESVAP